MAQLPAPVANNWSTSLFDCCADPGGCGRCCYGSCCGPCLYGNNLQKMPTELCCGGSSCGACCAFYMLGGFVPTLTAALFVIPVPLSCSFIIHMNARKWIREKYDIPGSGCNDCLVTCFCIPCALCQEAREIDIRRIGQVAGPIIVVAPHGMPPAPMAMAPQPMQMAPGIAMGQPMAQPQMMYGTVGQAPPQQPMSYYPTVPAAAPPPADYQKP